METRVISYSVYGNNPTYLVGMLKNVQQCQDIYPGWMPLIWTDTETYHNNQNIFSQLEGLTFSIHIADESNMPKNKMFWRFLVADMDWVDRFLVRDADSRLTVREAKAVEEWIQSGKPFHSCRDHLAHGRSINGGMWGSIKGVLPNMRTSLKLWEEKTSNLGGYGDDQEFLGQVIWPLVAENTLHHSSVYMNDYPNTLPFPMKREGHRFMGEVWIVDQNGNEYPRARDWEAIEPNS